jgi:hypothetical protein
MYVVRGGPCEGGGAVVVTRRAREDALAAAIDCLDQGMPSVTIIGDSRSYTAAEFALANPWLKNMPRGPKGEKRPADVIGAAVMVGRIATGEPAPGETIERQFYFKPWHAEARTPHDRPGRLDRSAAGRAGCVDRADRHEPRGAVSDA